MKTKFPIREVGFKFGEWEVLEYLPCKVTGKAHTMYKVKCSCGTTQNVTAASLETKQSTKCRSKIPHIKVEEVVEVAVLPEPNYDYNENLEVKYNSEYMSYKEFHSRYCPRYESLAGVIAALKSGTEPARIIKNYCNYTKRKGLV